VEKTLVCVISQTREYDIVWDKFKQNILDVLNADLALCISVDDNYDYNNPFWQTAKFKWTTHEYDNWIDAFEYARLTEFPEHTDRWKNLLYNNDSQANWLSPINNAPGAGAILIFFRWLLLHHLRNDKVLDQYDRFVITRSDFMYLCPHPPMELMDPKYVWVPDGEYHGGVTDRYAVLSRQNVEGYLSILKHIITNPDLMYQRVMMHTFKNLEAAVKNTLDIEFGETTRYLGNFPYFMYSVRSKDTSTRWAPGYWNEQLGYYVKYPDELYMAEYYSEIIKHKDDWHTKKIESADYELIV
jgi:hypothetical protein